MDSTSFLVKMGKSVNGNIIDKPTASNTGVTTINNLNKIVGVKKFERIAKRNSKSKGDAAVFQWYRVEIPGSKMKITEDSPAYERLKSAMEMYKHHPNIVSVEPNFEVNILLTPNDPYYSSSGSAGGSYPDLYGIQKINSSAAWDLTTGSSSIIVADIDTGVDYTHPDLAANMWVNTKEIQNNGIDDDANGYIDDYLGWDFVNNDNDPMDDMGHGSHTVGTIAGVGNNGLGVVGVNWTSKIMALKFLDNQGGGYTDDGIEALIYAADMGARVASNSWGGAGYDQALDDAINYGHDKGMVVVAAAGNSNADAMTSSPASSGAAITVAATDSTDARASFSNNGEKIDVAAPGVNILSVRSRSGWMCSSSVTVGSDYCYVSGTSMATPHVAGLAALILSKNPALNPEEVRQILRVGANDLGTAGKDSSFGYGRINAFNSLQLANSKVLTPYIHSPITPSDLSGTQIQIIGSVGGSNFASYKVELGSGIAPTTWTSLGAGTTQPLTPQTLGTFDGSRVADGIYNIRLTSTDTSGKIYQAQRNRITIKNFELALTSPGFLANKGQIKVYGTAKTLGSMGFANYKLEVNIGSQWILIGSGSSPVTNDQLGIWDTTGLNNGAAYTLRLTVTASNGITNQIQKSVTIDSSILSGWPILPSYNTSPHWTYLGDVNGDGKKDVIVVGVRIDENYFYHPMVTVYGYDGNPLPGFPVSVPLTSGANWAQFQSQPTVADINGDGKTEIIININSISDYSPLGSTIVVLGENGRILPGWNIPADGYDNAQGKSLFVADINNDGKKDILSLKRSGGWELYAYDWAGKLLPGFPRNHVYENYGNGNEVSEVTVHDLDNDGNLEFAMGVDNKAYLFDDYMNVLPGWPYLLPSVTDPTIVASFMYNSRISSGDFFGDGNKELFFYSDSFCKIGGGLCQITGQGTVVGLRKNGSLLSGWPKFYSTDGFQIWHYVGNKLAVSLADTNGDGADDVVVPSQPIVIYTKGGLLKYPKATPIATGVHMADVDGDGKLEFLSINYNANSVNIYDDISSAGSATAPMWQRNVYRPYDTGYFGDIDGDGKLELVQWSQTSGIIAWKLDYGKQGQYEWPMSGQNPMRTNNLKLVLGSTTPPVIPPPVPPSPVAHIQLSPTSLNFTASVGSTPATQQFKITNSGTAPLNWTATTNASWCHVNSSSGSIAAGANTMITVSPDSLTSAATYNCTISIADVAADNSPQNITVNYTVTAVATVPATPTGFTATPSTCGNNWLNLSWNSSSGATSYRVLRDGTQVYNGSGTTYSDTGLTAGGTYTYSLTASNSAGSSAPASTSGTVAQACPPAAPDTTPPSVNISNPTNGTQLKKNANVNTKADATDNIGVARVEFYVNNSLICTDNAAPYSCSWKPSGVSGSTYQIQAQAYDGAGNVGVSSIVQVTSK